MINKLPPIKVSTGKNYLNKLKEYKRKVEIKY